MYVPYWRLISFLFLFQQVKPEILRIGLDKTCDKHKEEIAVAAVEAIRMSAGAAERLRSTSDTDFSRVFEEIFPVGDPKSGEEVLSEYNIYAINDIEMRC